MTETEYRKTKAINIHLLQDIHTNPRKVKNFWDGMEDTETKPSYFGIGSMVDCLLTRPNDFEKEYAYMNCKISPGIKSIADAIYLRGDTTSIDEILKEREFQKYQMNWKEETFLKNFAIEAAPYFIDVKLAEGKTLVSKEDWDLAHTLADDAKNDEFCGKYFDPFKTNIEYQKIIIQEDILDSWFESDNITFTTHKLPLKGMLDLIVHEDDGSITPYDIKTYFGMNEPFVDSYYKYRYYLQAQFYVRLLQLEYGKQVKINPFRFIAIDSSRKNLPMVYEINRYDSFMADEMIYDMLRSFSWHIRNDKWNYPKECYLNGVISLRAND